MSHDLLVQMAYLQSDTNCPLRVVYFNTAKCALDLKVLNYKL